MTEIYLIRHGEAEGNVFRRMHGHYDSLLMPRGYAQRSRLQERFENIKIDACFSSDLTRTCLTAESIYKPKGIPLQKDSRFREVNVGVWEDIPFGYLDCFYPADMDRFSHAPQLWRVSGSEPYGDYTQRFIDGMVDAAQQYPGGTVAIFCHGAVLRGVLMRLFFRDQPEAVPFGDNTAVCHLYYRDGQFFYEYLNDNSHIPVELSTHYCQLWWRKNDNRREANLYFEPYTPGDENSGISLPPMEDGGTVMTAKLYSGPVGFVSMGKQIDHIGVLSGITLREDMLGRYYSDQLLGCAWSHFRRLGCRCLQASRGEYPDQVLDRYGFDPQSRMRRIDLQNM